MPAKSTAVTAEDVILAWIANPRFSAQRSLASRTHDAPSVSGVLFPAVSVPSSERSNTGRKAPSFSMLVSARMLLSLRRPANGITRSS